MMLVVVVVPYLTPICIRDQLFPPGHLPDGRAIELLVVCVHVGLYFESGEND